jgi:hypothetical protein
MDSEHCLNTHTDIKKRAKAIRTPRISLDEDEPKHRQTKPLIHQRLSPVF